MKNESMKDKPVTHAVFNQGMKNLDEKINRVAIDVVNMKQDMREMEERIEKKMAINTDRIMVQVDNLVSMWKEQTHKGYFNQNRLNNLDDHVADHEKRLVALEVGRIGPS